MFGHGKQVRGTWAWHVDFCLRTPRVCDPLTGLPDDDVQIEFRGKPASGGAKHCALGCSLAAQVMAWLGRRAGLVDVLMEAI